ncbi:MAG: hypothetical protein ACREMR_09570 [Gemmatimonadales bacterium]
MTHDPIPHLSTEEIELWAQGLLGAARTMHLTECSLCFAEAARERKLELALAQLPRFAPAAGFAHRVMAHVRLPTPSREFQG